MARYNILITGITGFLGRNLLKYISKNKLDFNIYGIANSEKKMALFARDENIKVYKLNLTSDIFYSEFDKILKVNKIDYIIHNAAMKFVDICENNPIDAIKTNTIASSQIVDLCKINNVKNLIALSTDKSNTPFNVYGMSKNIMERIVLKEGYAIYQGANFFGSDGSVVDIWFNQMSSNLPLSVTDTSCIRYFNDIEYICSSIIDNLDTNGIFLPKYVYKIQVGILLDAFCRKFNYSNVIISGKKSYEKDIEDLDPSITDIREMDLEKTIEFLDAFFHTNSMYVFKMNSDNKTVHE